MLSDLAIRRAKPRDRAYKMHDSAGLYLFVSPKGAKVWRWDYRFAGKRRTMVIGSLQVYSLAIARSKVLDLRRVIGEGRDPALEDARQRVAESVTFGQIADEFVQRMRDRHPPAAERTVSKADCILGRLCADLRQKPIRAVTSADVLAVLNTLVDTGRRETARRSKSVISGVFRLAVSTLRAETDPTYVLKGALLPPKVVHMAAITDEVAFGRLLTAIDESTGWWSVKAYLRFLALTFVRPGEARLAKWSEVDLERAVWVIPAERMKMRRQHEVPMSRQAVELLKRAREIDRHSTYLFPSLRTNRKPLSENAANSALRKIGYSKDEMVAHGFRSSASTMLNRRRFDRDVIEMQLAHAPEDRIRAIYNRDQMWDDRVKLMQRWADLLDDMQML